VISVAVVHHLSTDQRRQVAINELYRICKPGGLVLIYVWAFEQVDRKTKQQKYTEQDVFIPWHLQKQFNSTSSNTTSSTNNFELDTTNNERVYKRYYHLFKQGELETLVQQVPDIESIVETHFEADNWIVVGRKNQ
jgi:ubiquinone/menaquinone biosynthesis C-methylase UbiE